MFNQFNNDTNRYFVTLVLVLIMTLLGSLANYSYKVISGERFRIGMLLLQCVVSVFSGALVLMAAIYYGWNPEIAGGLSGLAGWSGAGFISVLEKTFLKRVGNDDYK